MTITIIIACLCLIVLIIGKVNLSLRFNRQVKALFSQSSNISDQYFHESELKNLPEPVQRYFKYTLKEGQSYISYARIKHDGQFKADLNKGWMQIKGEQYATTQRPGFIWNGTTAMFDARDMYISDHGRLIVTLFSIYNIVDAHDKAQYDSGEMLRWLGESVLYPTNLLPSNRLVWKPIDDEKAKLTFNYKGQSLYFVITVNGIGEITEMETKRFMDENSLETWIIKPTNYKELNGLKIPTYFDVSWRLDGRDFSYAKFRILEVEYDKPAKF